MGSPFTRSASRSEAFGQTRTPTWVDRCGVWLSARRLLGSARFARSRIGDFGCGYHATFVRSVLDRIDSAVLVDVAIAEELRNDPKITAIEGTLPDAIARVEAQSLDVVLCISVLEHLWDPLGALTECRRVVKPGGTCLFNVPTWRGKRFLELSAFRLGLSPAEEMDDHKMYYDPRDLWPLLVRAGFLPHNIQCYRHKFGLNTFAVCKADSEGAIR